MLKLSKKEKESVNSRFSENALKMMKKRYLAQDREGNPETPADMFLRVANSIAEVEKKYGKDERAAEAVARDFFDVMASKEYTPAGRTLTNAGSDTPLIANCIVLPIHDSMESIFQTLRDAALLQQAGSGLGFDLSEMRPADYPTKKSRGKASGPVSFLKVYDAAFATIKQQGRHGANMAMMRVDHPDVLDFITAKTVEGELRNFNISVTVTDEFMEQLQKNPDKQWYCSFNGKKVKPRKVFRHPNGAVDRAEDMEITAQELFDKIVDYAWLNGEPGIAFIDTINRTNPLPDMGPIACSNPCGEQFLHPYDNCNLGSINLALFVKDKKVDWKRLKFVTRSATRLMDNVIDKFDFPVQQVTDLAMNNRRIGLGIMGFADMLYQMGVRYDSKEGFATAERVMGFINKEAYGMSQELAKEKGSFPNYEKSVFAKKKAPHATAQEWGIGKPMRNAALTTVAPTGSISMMFDVSSGIEPNFALAYIKQDKDGLQYKYFNSHFKKSLDALKFSKEEQESILKEVIDKGTIQHLEYLPKELRETFVVAMDISGLNHMKMQAAFQKHVDNSISKTVNFPNSATKEEIADTFVQAWRMGCKACTVYRDGSRVIQILNVGTGENIIAPTETPVKGLKEKEVPMVPQIGTPRPRPEIMSGKTYRIKTGYGKLYITINNDEKGVPFEVFATIGKSGGFFQEQSEAICRLISLSLRSGVRPQEVVGHLKGIRGPMPVFTDKGTVLSLPDALGRTLEQHIGAVTQVEDVLARPEKQEVLPFAGAGEKIDMADFGFMPGCPECGSQLVMQEGCISCKSCGFSRCS
ncbi:MAG: adenosylcobalamin-dependent ribonucleoside-diphosphate reductase [Candidatus Wildermuthbacteria bacterium]|nr:adenosylcobalamin-dependent ribonucleoside-diphosphate reductase [Candidatus Wildermuthbacteria bacterium]